MKKVLITLCALGIVAVGCETREHKAPHHDGADQHRNEAVRPVEAKPAEVKPAENIPVERRSSDARAAELKNEIRNEIKNGLKPAAPAAPNGR